jgi:hypothetical protein
VIETHNHTSQTISSSLLAVIIVSAVIVLVVIATGIVCYFRRLKTVTFPSSGADMGAIVGISGVMEEAVFGTFVSALTIDGPLGFDDIAPDFLNTIE